MANVTFPQLIQRACGIDVHSKVVVATVQGDGLQRETRNFYTFMMRVLEDCNIKLSCVVSDTSGVTATSLINMICDGKTLTLEDIMMKGVFSASQRSLCSDDWACAAFTQSLRYGSRCIRLRIYPATIDSTVPLMI